MNGSESSHSHSSAIRILSGPGPEDPFPRRILLVFGAGPRLDALRRA